MTEAAAAEEEEEEPEGPRGPRPLRISRRRAVWTVRAELPREPEGELRRWLALAAVEEEEEVPPADRELKEVNK